MVSMTDPYGRILGFLDRDRLPYNNQNLSTTGGSEEALPANG
jgi:hypothetical protein